MDFVYFYLIGPLVVGTFGAYTGAFQRATLYWGKKLAGDSSNLPTGFQDAITPQAQTNRNIISMLLYVLVFVIGIWDSGVWSGLSAFVVSIIVSMIAGTFMPRPDSNHFAAAILRSLVDRRALYKSKSDDLRVEAIDQMLYRFRSQFPAQK